MAKTPASDSAPEKTVAPATADSEPKAGSEITPEKGPDLQGAPGVTGDTVTVETTGDFMLFDPFSQEVVEASGESTVHLTSFIQNALDDGRLKKA